jgi:hypothetical protein
MSVTNAFHDLITALQESLETAKASGAQAFQRAEFETAQKAADRGQALQSILESAEELKSKWEGVEGTDDLEEDRWDVQVGLEPTQEDLIFPVLYVLDQAGGNAPSEEILDRVEALLKEKLTPEEFGSLSEGWAGPLRGSASKLERQMARRGLIHAKGQPGHWNLTPQGRMSLLEQQG